MEIIALRHRTLQEVVPALRPLLEPGGALSGMNDQLIVRASPRNREQIRQALAAIDTPARRLLIRVRQNRDRNVASSAYEWRSAQSISSVQMVQVVEGGRALIQVGKSLPVPLRQLTIGPRDAMFSESVVYHDLGQGFYAAPRVTGERVTLEISPQFDYLPGGQGAVDRQRLLTTVSGRLGEWLEIGGSSQQAEVGERDSSIWLQVEELP